VSSLFSSVLGGVLIGLAATLYWVTNCRVAGVSGIVRDVLVSGAPGARREALAFLLGLFSAGAIGALFRAPPAAATAQPVAVLLVAGLLVGFGTNLGGGCTSGHGVCGVARLRVRSLVATAVFIAAGAISVALIGRLLPGWSAR
jgi:uncharacterized membrane protein YedE/YeeE